MKILPVIFTLFFVVANASAQAPKTRVLAKDWGIVLEKSKIEFQALQENNQVIGSFEKFSGKVNFDPKNLPASRVAIDVEIDSVKSSFAQAVGALKTASWLYSSKFPKASFLAEKFTKIDNNKFRAEGYLSLKGKGVPISFDFVLEEYTSKSARAVGMVVIKRSDFGVGDADPKKANGVKEEVVVKFVLQAAGS